MNKDGASGSRIVDSKRDGNRMDKGITLGIDIGGTFTDYVAYNHDTQTAEAWKFFSDASDPAKGIVDGLKNFSDLGDVQRIRLGTTIATNAILERNGATVGYITTKNFTDVPFIGRGDRKGIYDAHWRKPAPLVKREHTFGVEERISSEGKVLSELNEDELRNIAQSIQADDDIEVLALNFLFSYIDPAHELRAKEILQSELPDMQVSISFEVMPKWKEYERASTTIADAYVKPIVNNRIPKIQAQLAELAPQAELVIMKSNGGETSVESACAKPVDLMLSGPSGGVVATQYISSVNSFDRVMTFDMGGTSSDCALCVDGDIPLTNDFEVEWGIPVQVPMVDVRTIGAGGGSIAWVDNGGMLQVGPRSAGSQPGPICYSRGGTEPTVTDANVILGRIDPENFLGGAVKLDAEGAYAALGEIGKRLNLSAEQAAKAVIDIANNNIAAELRALAVENGHDPRSFSLMGFGGAGPVHTADLMQMLNIDTGMIPVYPGQFSAFGFTCSDVRIDRQRTLQMRSDKMDYGRINAVADTLRTATLDDLGEQGATKDCSLVFSVDVRYDGQNYELSVPVQFDEFTPEAIAMLRTDFDALFLERYGFNQVGEVIEFVNLNLAAVVLQDKPQIQNNQSAETVAKPTSTRKVWFADGWIKTPVYMRSDVGVGITIPGPAIIEEDVSVLPVNPGQTVTANATGVLILETQGRKT